MIRQFLAHVLAGLIFLSILGAAGELLGPTITTIVGGSALVGCLLLIALRYRRKATADRGEFRITGIDDPSGEWILVDDDEDEPSLLGFPDRPIIPTRDARFGE